MVHCGFVNVEHLVKTLCVSAMASSFRGVFIFRQWHFRPAYFVADAGGNYPPETLLTNSKEMK